MCFKICSKNGDSGCPCKDYSEYELKLKCMKTKLHSRYIACIATGIVIWLITTGTATNELFPEWISFASTITSIILSVIAIIMSISGESKTDAIRNDLTDTAKKLDEMTKQMNKEMLGTNEEIKKSISQLGEQIRILQDKVDAVPKQVNEYAKTNKKYPENSRRNSTRNKLDWGNNNEKR